MKEFLFIILTILLFAIPSHAEFFRDAIITSPNGIWTDSRAYSTLNDAIAAVGTNERTIKIVSPQVVTSLTVPSNVTLSFERNGSITNSGQLTINTRNIIAKDRQIFTGTGDIDFAVGSVVRSAWFSDIANAISMTNDDELTLIISKPSIVSADLTVPSSVCLRIEKGCSITVDTGKTLTINSFNGAGKLWKIFEGDGSVKFGSGAVEAVYPEWFGAQSDYDSSTKTGTNNKDFIVKACNSVTGSTPVKLLTGSGYAINSTLTIPVGVSFIQEKPIYYIGSSNEPALVVGAQNVDNSSTLKLSVIRANQSDWSDMNSIGILIYPHNTSNIEIVNARNFTIGVKCYAYGHGFSYNTIKLVLIHNNMYGLYLVSDNSGYINENLWIGGRISVYSGTNTSLDRYGIVIDTIDGVHVPNNNVFLKPSIEIESGSTGISYAIWFKNAGKSHFYGGRSEGNTYLFRDSPPSASNIVEFDYANPSTILKDDGAYASNIRLLPYTLKPIFSIPNIMSRWCPYDNTHFCFRGLSLLRYSTPNILSNTDRISYDPVKGVYINDAVGIMVDTSNCKNFMLSNNNISGPVILCYDTSGNRLCNNSDNSGGDTTKYVSGDLSKDSYAQNYYKDANGVGNYVYTPTSNVLIYFRPEVKKAFIGVGGATYVTGFTLSSINYNGGVNCYTGNDDVQEDSLFAIQAPLLGTFSVGTSVRNVNVSAGGIPGWMCVSKIDTTIKVAGATGDTSLDVDSTSGMASGDVIGIYLDNGSVHWTTISSITDADTLVITDALPSAASVDNKVYTNRWKAMAALAA